MFSISFLPWLLLLLGVVLSIPIVAYTESNRRKKAAAAAAATQADATPVEEEEGFGEVAGFDDTFGGEEVIAAEGDLGEVGNDEFDEDAFK